MVKRFLATTCVARITCLASVACAAILGTAAFADTSLEKRELTPADAIATTRIFENQLTLGERVDTGTASPDRKRYLLRLVHGDVDRNGDWMDLLTGTLDSLDTASHPKLCAHLFTSGLGLKRIELSAEADPLSTNIIQWVNNTQVAFLWSDSNDIRQVMSMDTLTCKHRFLTDSATDVFSFAIAPDGSLLFNVQVPRTSGASQRLWKQGFAISPASDGWSILKGQIDGADANSMFDNAWFIRSGTTTRPIGIAGKHTDRTMPLYRDLFLSKTADLALIDVGIDGAPAGWDKYTNPVLQSLVNTDQSIPGRTPLRYALIDLKSASSRLLWDAPRAFRGQVAWSPNSDSLLLAPTFLPTAANTPLGLSGNAAAILDVNTGKYQVLPIDLTARTVVATEWLTPITVEIRSTNDAAADLRIDRLVYENNHWIVAFQSDPVQQEHPYQPPTIRLETRRSLNRPPQVFAVDSASGESRLVLDPNPHLLERFKLGRVERLSGTLSNGKNWVGQLIYPADYTPGTRYPLVIQSTYGRVFGQEDFSLDGTWGFPGMGLGPALFSAYPGQLLATRNIAVLSLTVAHFSPGSAQDDDYQLAFESLAKQLISSGLVNPDKIALLGFSRNGHWVEFTLAHSAFPFAAAIAADNYDPSYFQAALMNWRTEDAAMNNAPAFGDGLQKWISRAVGFNAEHIQTPLLMIGMCGSTDMIIGEWEIFSRLEYLKKPVEMYMMPEVDTHPSHVPQNPRQIMAIQDKTLDWLSFWLTGREDPNPSKAEQYRHWHEFKHSSAVSNP